MLCREHKTNWLFGNKIPREGTETSFANVFIFHISFGNKIPREGTETHAMNSTLSRHYLEIRYPERGRKHFLEEGWHVEKKNIWK